MMLYCTSREKKPARHGGKKEKKSQLEKQESCKKDCVARKFHNASIPMVRLFWPVNVALDCLIKSSPERGIGMK